MKVLKNGKLYEVREEEFLWKVVLSRNGSEIVFTFGKREFSDFESVRNYLKLCADF